MVERLNVGEIYDRAYEIQGQKYPFLMGTRAVPKYNRETKELLIRLAVNDEKGEGVLELGTGDGDMGLFMGDNVTWYGIDISEVGLSTAKKRFPRLLPCAGNIINLPYPSDSFCTVIAADTLEHSPNPGQTLEEIRRVLKSGGIFCTSLPVPKLFGRVLYNIFRERNWKQLAIVARSAAIRTIEFGRPDFQPIEAGLELGEWKSLFVNHGFTIEQSMCWPDQNTNLKPLAMLIKAKVKSSIAPPQCADNNTVV